MSFQEIPMFRCSIQFKDRLIDACGKFNESKYSFWRRVNWSYRFSNFFLEKEATIFCENPDKYISGIVSTKPTIDDVYEVTLPWKQTVILALKVVAHWLFRSLGRFAATFSSTNQLVTYRKAYVDDIEQVFETDQKDVLRMVYPFPLNMYRQWKYIRFLNINNYRFRLSGNPYSIIDLTRFLWKRNVRSLYIMETHAQLRHAKELVGMGFVFFQLSDEFDVGSLTFCRMLRRYHVKIVNSAHGVGTYMPVHSYDEFIFLTDHQKKYYISIRQCIYTPRRLNIKYPALATGFNKHLSSKVILVFLSQVSASVTKIVPENEKIALKRLSEEFGRVATVELLYRPHPNNSRPSFPLGFNLLRKLEDVNGYPGVIFVSFFSTCYIDPNFVGCKILLTGNLIYPSLIYGEDENILTLDGLVAYTHQRLNQRNIEFRLKIKEVS